MMQNINSVSAADTAVNTAKSQQLSQDQAVKQEIRIPGTASDQESVNAVNGPKALKDTDVLAKIAKDKQQDNAEEQQDLSEEELAAQREKAKELSAKLNAQNIGLEFSVDDNTSSTVINVMNRSTEDLVRQIPSEDLLRFQQIIADFEDKVKTSSPDDAGAKDSKDMLKGLILDEIV